MFWILGCVYYKISPKKFQELLKSLCPERLYFVSFYIFFSFFVNLKKKCELKIT